MVKILLMAIGSCLLCAGLFYSFFTTMGLSLGALWGYINLLLIRQLMSGLLLESPANYLKNLGIALVKFPILYGCGYGLLSIKQFSPWILLLGFSLALPVIMLCWASNTTTSVKES